MLHDDVDAPLSRRIAPATHYVSAMLTFQRRRCYHGEQRKDAMKTETIVTMSAKPRQTDLCGCAGDGTQTRKEENKTVAQTI